MHLSEEKKILLEQYGSELEEYIRISNAWEKRVFGKEILSRYASTLGITTAELEADALLISAPTYESPDKVTCMTLSQILGMKNDSEDWIAPNLIRAGGGLVLVSGAPKAGKTLLAGYELAYSMTVSGDFLGAPCKIGRVLIFQTEEGWRTIRRRLMSKGMENYNKVAQQAIKEERIIVERNFSITNIPLLKGHINKYQPDLVIFDSLRGITAGSNMSENQADFGKPIYLLQKVLTSMGVTGILIHHSKKGSKGGSIEDLSGSSAIGAACDGAITLTPIAKSDDNLISLQTVPRDAMPVHYEIARYRDPTTGYWGFKKIREVGVPEIVVKIEKKILRYLSKMALNDPGKKVTKDTIETFLSMPPDASSCIDAALERLVEASQISEGKIANESKACGFDLVFSVPSDSPWISFGTGSHPEYQEAEELLKCKTKDDIEKLYFSWEREYGTGFFNKVWECIVIHEKIPILTILNPYKYAVGDNVINRVTQEKLIVREVIPYFKKSAWRYRVEGKEDETIFEHDELSLLPSESMSEINPEEF
jgi:hypothetical protein